MTRTQALRMAKANKARKHVASLRVLDLGPAAVRPGSVSFTRPLNRAERTDALRAYNHGQTVFVR